MFDRKIDAQRFLTGLDADINRGTYLDPAAGKTLFKDYAAEWMEAQTWRPSSRAGLSTTMRLQVMPQWGDRPLNSIRPTEVQAWATHLLTAGRTKLDDDGREVSYGYAPASVERAVSLFSNVLAAAVDDGLLPASPVRRIRVPRESKPAIVPLTIDEVGRLRDAVPDGLKIAVTIAAGVGLRWGEVAGLTLDRVDFLRRRVTIDRQLSPMWEPDSPVWGPPKTAASNRVVPVPEVVLDEINVHLAKNQLGRQGLILSDKGRPYMRQAANRRWRQARASLGLDRVRFHDLRHHCASLLIHAGCSVKVVQAQLGHATAAETLDTYAHLWPDADDLVRDAVDNAWRGVS